MQGQAFETLLPAEALSVCLSVSFQHCNGVDWRQKLDSQRGAVLATELKNNSYKLARWTCCAMLAGSEYLKLGYVSRYHVKDSARHIILGTQQFKPNEFASQINLSMENAWGILRCVIDTCMKLEEGKYLILKDPNKQVIRAYSLPDGTFSSDEDEDEEEEEEDEEDDGESEGRCNSWAYTVLICSCGQKFSITL
ncbi:eukaryotic translation initiation factor 3 subunit D-like [Acipenser ruthenus]|uniref:eukaryotic translation initiation factor 3 subunit D-like n=1 Tax=Acipenser ruthenus TaxID=7906 RepID=UPI002740F777|nr:eukaryotic translation initiation factor 3 subunit D-like [Acipenser ruthenus]